MRLDKFLSDASPCSRRDVRKLVNAGAVTVDGIKAESVDQKVTETSCIQVRGKTVAYRKYIYLMLNKPQGYISATEDKHDPVVVELVPDDLKHFAPFPVGRLDKDTEGLLLLTNDGQFDHELMSPRKKVMKRYFAVLDKPAETADIEAFKAGMEFRDFTAKPGILEITANPCEVFVEIAEGKFHQVKRMCEKTGKKVLYLKRVKIGSLALDPELAPGQMRELSAAEYSSLMG